MKILTVVGTRPEVIRLSRVLNTLEQNLENILVHTGQNYDYELNQVFIQDLKKARWYLDKLISELEQEEECAKL